MKIRSEEFTDFSFKSKVKIASEQVDDVEALEYSKKLYKRVARWKWLKQLFGLWNEPMVISVKGNFTQKDIEDEIEQDTEIGKEILEALKYNKYWGEKVDD